MTGCKLCLGGKTVVNHNNNKRNIFPRSLFRKNGLLKKIALSTFAFTTIMIGSAVADNQISTVYHVYINGENMGTVDNEQVVNQVIDTKIASIQKEYEDLELIADNIKLIPEQVFRSNVNNSETTKKIASTVDIVANVSAVVIEDEIIAYLSDEEAANEAIKRYKLKYVNEEDLLDIEARNKTEVVLPTLKEGESRIVDVQLVEKVSVSQEKINPSEVLTVEEALKLLEKGTLEEKKYSVKTGDVLGSIAVDHNLTTKELLALNPGLNEDSLIKVGQELNVTAFKPLLTVQTIMEEVKAEKIDYTYEIKEDSNMYKGDQKVQQQGEEGQKVVNYVISKSNGQTVKKEKASEEIIKEAIPHIVVKGTKVVPSRGTGQLAWPAVGGYISSQMGYRWGQMHKGIDIARPSNRTIKAADNGTIVSAGWDGGYGNKIVIDHNNGFRTVYAHLDSISVNVGQTVSQGQQIGVMGSTGHSTGVHLHFEVYKNGSLRNPLEYLSR